MTIFFVARKDTEDEKYDHNLLFYPTIRGIILSKGYANSNKNVKDVMRKLLSISLVYFLFISCTKDHPVNPNICEGEIDLSSEIFPQYWMLVKMTGNIPNSETTGNNMTWQEHIVLNVDSTFTKSRTRDNVTTEASGKFSYSIVGNENAVQLNLTYDDPSDLIDNCFGDVMHEVYVFTSKCKLRGTVDICDGPGLEYDRQSLFPECGTN